jgi:predicted aconitase with swiveling domain
VGDLLCLDEPLSLWGGTDPETGTITDERHPQYGVRLTGRVVVTPASRGSSSSASVLAEQLRLGVGPAAIVLVRRDPILVIGALVAEELYGRGVPVIEVESIDVATLRRWSEVRVVADGTGAVVVALS